MRALVPRAVLATAVCVTLAVGGIAATAVSPDEVQEVPAAGSDGGMSPVEPAARLDPSVRRAAPERLLPFVSAGVAAADARPSRSHTSRLRLANPPGDDSSRYLEHCVLRL